MSHTSKIFEDVPIKVQKRNGFDLSHIRVGSAKTGQLVPVMCKLLPPNSTFTLGVAMNVELPPLATQFFGRVDAIVEGFVVPCSILYGGWKQFITGAPDIDGRGARVNAPMFSTGRQPAGGYALPRFVLSDCLFRDVAGFDTLIGVNDNLACFLGFKIPNIEDEITVPDIEISLLPFLAYHRIWDVFYRNSRITRTVFSVNPNIGSLDSSASSSWNSKNVSLVWHSFYGLRSGADSEFTDCYFRSSEQLTFPDGVSIFSTRQRNYSRDYFTSAMPDAQQGLPSVLRFSLGEDTGEFSIASLRAANALQKFLETNGLSGDYKDMMRHRWGASPLDADFEEPYYLGRCVVPVYQKSVYKQDQGAPNVGGTNPFVGLGAQGAKTASGSFAGEGSITQKFTLSYWGYVFCNFSLVPRAQYSFGLHRDLTMVNLGDFPAPELQTIGHEAIYNYELYLTDASGPNMREFGYIPRYSRFKYMDDEVVGELAPYRSLQYFALQRRFSSLPELSSSFLEIPQNALDSVFSVNTAGMNLSCWYEIYFRFKVVMPLADFCVPTLGDLHDTTTLHTHLSGSRL